METFNNESPTSKHTVLPPASESARDYLDLDGIRAEVGLNYEIFAACSIYVEDADAKYVSRRAWAEEVTKTGVLR